MDEISKERVGALSDGVIAIAATLLVLELKLPQDHALSPEYMLEWARVFFGWIVSFAMIAILWFENHLQLAHASRWTVRLTIVTFAHLGLLSLVPFASNLIMDDPGDLGAALAFNAILLANGLCSACGTWLLSRQSAIHRHPGTARLLARRSLFQMVAYTGVAIISLIGAVAHHPFIGVALWLLMPFFVWIRFQKLDRVAVPSRQPRKPV